MDQFPKVGGSFEDSGIQKHVDRVKNPMNRKSAIATIVLVILAACVVVLYKNYDGRLPFQGAPAETGSARVPAGWTTYVNKDYGFQVSYPANIIATTTFQGFYHLSPFWRSGMSSDSKGEPIISISVYRIEKRGTRGEYVSYPMYFDTELRIGASRNPDDVAQCLKPNAGYGDTNVASTTINGTVFSIFTLQDAAMMQYLGGESYRTVHDGACVAVERVEAGSDYRDVTSSDDIPDSVLRSYYDETGKILQTFRFLSGENAAPSSSL